MYLVAIVYRFLISLRYRVTFKNEEIMKSEGAKLFLPNHQALVDPQMMVAFELKHQFISPVLTASFYNIPVLKNMFKWFKAVPVNDLEKGSRDTGVLKFVYSNVINALKEGRNILLYPSGQLSNSGLERICNKQSAWLITQDLPNNARIIGVRIHGLWGSIWSKARTGKTPNLILLLVESWWIIMVNLIFFIPKRMVTFEFVDITEEAIAKAQLGRKAYNEFLEGFYNIHGEEPMNKLGHYFFLPK